MRSLSQALGINGARTGWPTTSRQSRGYGAEWQAKRLRVLSRDGHLCQCEHCKAEGRVRVATQVDHVVSRAKAKALGWTSERTEDMANLQAINAECHARKTIEEQGGKVAVRIGLDGYPIES